jgi:hypothetical protein
MNLQTKQEFKCSSWSFPRMISTLGIAGGNQMPVLFFGMREWIHHFTDSSLTPVGVWLLLNAVTVGMINTRPGKWQLTALAYLLRFRLGYIPRIRHDLWLVG